jgi:hypothetical protein
MCFTIIQWLYIWKENVHYGPMAWILIDTRSHTKHFLFAKDVNQWKFTIMHLIILLSSSVHYGMVVDIMTQYVASLYKNVWRIILLDQTLKEKNSMNIKYLNSIKILYLNLQWFKYVHMKKLDNNKLEKKVPSHGL